MLVRKETVPDDIHGMFVAQGILTATGGMTSHAAVVGRQMGKPSVVGAGALEIDEHAKTVQRRRQDAEGRRLALVRRAVRRGEGRPGRDQAERDPAGRQRRDEAGASRTSIRRFNLLLSWADKFRRLGIRANADQPDQAEIAYGFGARGIGLCRTEHMFFGEGRIPIVQKMILADNEKDRRAALNELLPLQRGDFYGVFKAMHGIAGDDPHDRSAAARVPAEARRPDGRHREDGDAASESGQGARREEARCCTASSSCTSSTRCSAIAACVSASRYPEITEMQTRAIMEAACQLTKEGGKAVPEIMIPLVGDVRELTDQKAVVVARGRRGHEGTGRQGEVPGRHDDRGAARRDHRRRDRARKPTSSRSARTTSRS